MTIPDAVHDLIEYEVECARADGYHQALADVAERADALDQTWRPIERRDPEQVIAERAVSLPPAEGVDQWLEEYAGRMRRRDDDAILTGFLYPPGHCDRCWRGRPADVVCQCNGIVTRRIDVKARTT